MTCSVDHLRLHYNTATYKFGISRQLGDRIHDASYVTMFPTGVLKYGFTAETETYEDAINIEDSLKSYLSDLPSAFYPEANSREFACMEMDALKFVIVTLADENGVNINAVDWPVYERSHVPRMGPTFTKVHVSVKSRQKIALTILKTMRKSDMKFCMNEFSLFLTTVQDLNQDNATKVKRRVSELVSGQGVGAEGWVKRFRENEPVHIEEDLIAVRADACEHVRLYGKDPGTVKPQKGRTDVGINCKSAIKKGVRYDTNNGWTVNHPMGYLIKYKEWKETAWASS